MSEAMDNPLDQTTLATISLLESRLLRIEHVLFGSSASPSSSQNGSALDKMNDLDRRFTKMVSQIRVYSELLKIYKASPDLFHAPHPSQLPSQLSSDTIRSIVMSSASSFPATLSALTAVKDIPIPDATTSAHLVALTKRMKELQMVQHAGAAQIAQLRRKSEVLIRMWYENNAIQNSQNLADTEAKLHLFEREVRRRQKKLEEDRE